MLSTFTSSISTSSSIRAKMATTCSDLPQKSYNHLEDYHGASSASIPFTWESQPGTRKHNFHLPNNGILPPLTPPPSYNYFVTTRKHAKQNQVLTRKQAKHNHEGSSASIPFTWESQPGTPKHNFREIETNNDILPPLTPPPSYNYSVTTRKHARKNSKASLIYAIFSKRNGKKTIPPTSPSSSSSSSSSFYTSSPLPQSYSASYPTMLNGSRSSSDSSTDEEEHEYELPAPSWCTCSIVNRGASSRSRGLFASIIKVFVKRL